MAEENRLQDIVKQQLQMLAYQKQEFAFRVEELKKALEEVKKSNETYRFYGSILVKKDQKELIEEINAELKELQDRLQVMEMQEQKMKGISESKKQNFN